MADFQHCVTFKDKCYLFESYSVCLHVFKQILLCVSFCSQANLYTCIESLSSNPSTTVLCFELNKMEVGFSVSEARILLFI